jgi:hypothetical protein
MAEPSLSEHPNGGSVKFRQFRPEGAARLRF